MNKAPDLLSGAFTLRWDGTDALFRVGFFGAVSESVMPLLRPLF